MCESQHISPEQIYALSLAGNTTMTHLFLGLDPRWIIREPYIPVDVGTNAEVVLGNENWLIACAGAAGPALESSVTRMGMTAGLAAGPV